MLQICAYFTELFTFVIMILVTGGTGLIGAHLLYNLAQTKTRIRATYRSTAKRDATKAIFKIYDATPEALWSKIEWVQADIIELPELEGAFKDIEYVYHCAALISFDPNDYYLLRKTNIEGTANVVNLCLSHNIKKLCYVSSIATLGDTTEGTPITENTHWNPEVHNGVYGITKYGAEMEVWRGTQEGLQAVIVNPGVVLGPGFWNSGSGRLFTKVKQGLLFYTTGSTAYVDVRDVVSIMQQLMDSDIINERYILASENVTLKTFTQLTAKALGVKPPKYKANAMLLEMAWRLDWLANALGLKRRQFTKHLVASLASTSNYDSSKIKTALGFNFIPVKTSIEETCKYFKV